MSSGKNIGYSRKNRVPIVSNPYPENIVSAKFQGICVLKYLYSKMLSREFISPDNAPESTADLFSAVDQGLGKYLDYIEKSANEIFNELSLRNINLIESKSDQDCWPLSPWEVVISIRTSEDSKQYTPGARETPRYDNARVALAIANYYLDKQQMSKKIDGEHNIGSLEAERIKAYMSKSRRLNQQAQANYKSRVISMKPSGDDLIYD